MVASLSLSILLLISQILLPIVCLTKKMTLVLYSLFFDCEESVLAFQLANTDLSDHSLSTRRHSLAQIETLVLFVEC